MMAEFDYAVDAPTPSSDGHLSMATVSGVGGREGKSEGGTSRSYKAASAEGYNSHLAQPLRKSTLYMRMFTAFAKVRSP